MYAIYCLSGSLMYAAAESEDEIVDETVPQSPMKNQTTRSKYRTIIIPEAIKCSDSEDELPR